MMFNKLKATLFKTNYKLCAYIMYAKTDLNLRKLYTQIFDDSHLVGKYFGNKVNNFWNILENCAKLS